MSTLAEKLNLAARAPELIADLERLIEGEVSKKGGFSGAALKMGFSAIKAASPDFLPKSLNVLLPEFVAAMEPHWSKFTLEQAAGSTATFAQYLLANRSAVADTLLSVTDARAARAKIEALKKLYAKLRDSAKTHVEEALPPFSQIIGKYV